MKTLNIFLSLVVFLVSCITTTVLITTTFNWFVSPSFEIAELTFKQGFAIGMFFSVLFLKHENDGLDEKEIKWNLIYKLVMYPTGMVIVLVVNYILKTLFF